MMGHELWRWLWTGLAIVLAAGEIFTAGFFLLPFAAGAAAAAVLAWLGMHVLVQWAVFLVVSLVTLFYLQRYIRKQDQGGPVAVGANRWLNAQGVVLETIDPAASTGMIRIDGEQWRATTDGEVIPEGSRVVVRAVRGTRLVVRRIG